MVVATIPIKSAVFLFSLILFSCQNQINISENELINGQDIQKYILRIQKSGTAILVTDHNVKNLFDITDRAYVLGEHTVIAEGTSRELLKSSKAIEHYFGSQF